MDSKKNNLDFIGNYKTYAIVAIIFTIWLFGFLMYMQFNYTLEVVTDFGEIGDFFGGMLNPILAFIAFLALLKTIEIQSKELKTSNKALELTSEESKLSRQALQEQSKSIKLQNFENTFFNMLNLHNETIKSIYIPEDTFEANKNDIFRTNTVTYKDLNGTVAKNVLSKLYELLQYQVKQTTSNSNVIFLGFHRRTINYIGHYFRNIYQILKFISKSDIEDKKFYSNILRAQLSESELGLLFYNCASEIGIEYFLPLLVEFEFLEHLPYNENINSKDVLLYIKYAQFKDYKDSKVFGKNIAWGKAVNELV